MKYSKGIRKARLRARLSQRKLADAAGFDASYIAHLEAGQRVPSLDALERLASALGMPMSLLLLMCAEQSDLTGIGDEKVDELAGKLWKALAGLNGGAKVKKP